MKERIKNLIRGAIRELQEKEGFSAFKIPEIKVDYPSDKKFGDYSSNIAMVLARKLKKDPMEIAKSIKYQVSSIKHEEISSVEVVKPGYVNFYLSKKYLQDLVGVINSEKENFGSGDLGKGKKVLIEFISSNPTGPIHLGNGRGGPLGDALGNILEKSGYQIEREFFINDFGNQVEILGHSILKNKDAQYKGAYIDELAEKLKDEKRVKNKTNAEEVGLWAADVIIKKIIKPTCEKLGVKFDNWFSEKTLHNSKKVDEIIKTLKKKKLTYEKDGAVWYKSTKYGDDKDRVLVKSDGNKTYIAADFAYHKNKVARGFDKLINIQGADHHKEAEVVKNFVEKVLGEENKLDYILSQFVRIIKDGREVKMSKRKGVYFAMDDLIEEVGIDAVRFIFLSYTPNTHINFDINSAKERSEKNPVYYVQYAHSRIHSILEKFQILNLKSQTNSKFQIPNSKLSLLVHEKELDLMRELNKFPELIEEIARSYETHKLPHYAIKLADRFHSFYAECRVIDEDNPEPSLARQNLINTVRIVLREVLRLMGVNAPKRM